MCLTTPQLVLSAAYRKAQRLLAEWLEYGRSARRQVFEVRAAVANLDALERHRLHRWLAWWCVAAAVGRRESLPSRIRRLDVSLGEGTDLALSRLPMNVTLGVMRHHRKSA